MVHTVHLAKSSIIKRNNPVHTLLNGHVEHVLFSL